MSKVLIDQVLALVREKFGREVKTVQPYGGEFSASEIPFKSYTCPAIFIACMGWSPQPSGKRMSGRKVRATSMAAFIAFKHVNRELRMEGAMNLADRLALILSDWTPEDGDMPYTISPIDTDPTCENLYGRAVDSAGQALWMVRWTQDVKANAPPPQLFDLLRIEIEEHYLPGQLPPVPLPGGVVPTVTDQINFQQLPEEP